MTGYNGWTNYATWRLMLEVFDGYETDDSVSIDHNYVKEMAEEIVLGDDDGNTLAKSYAFAFMSDVNWHEIAEHINDDPKETE